MRAAFDRRRRTMIRMLGEIDGLRCAEPDGAFYVDVSAKDVLGRQIDGRRPGTTAELAAVLLEAAEVAVVPGEAFGGPGYLRLSYAPGRRRPGGRHQRGSASCSPAADPLVTGQVSVSSQLPRPPATSSWAGAAGRPRLDLGLAFLRPAWGAADDDVGLGKRVGVGVPRAPVGDRAVGDAEPAGDFDHVDVAVGRVRVRRRTVRDLALAVAHPANLAGTAAVTWALTSACSPSPAPPARPAKRGPPAGTAPSAARRLPTSPVRQAGRRRRERRSCQAARARC
ncbi:Aminotransferase class I and II [Amycolatopsis pretoriensis]|uniref:Aminotransferase class I and II n=1 Tax=Amycolatopsis pretoriensis TaxID=218821 RepID=A0A1H5RFJ9_9PSEU|nr:Aminotransferase class I and II [Amycolatopsis pretoriensis]